MEKPTWLPEMVSVDGDWDDVLERLYNIFDTDFKQARLIFRERYVWWDRRILEGEKYEEGFWHLISKKDHIKKDSLFDPRRAERLPWCGPTISNSNEDVVKVWDYQYANRKIRTYIWLENLDYVIILEKRQHRIGEIVFLITAFYVDGDSKRKDLRRKFEKKLI